MHHNPIVCIVGSVESRNVPLPEIGKNRCRKLVLSSLGIKAEMREEAEIPEILSKNCEKLNFLNYFLRFFKFFFIFGPNGEVLLAVHKFPCLMKTIHQC